MSSGSHSGQRAARDSSDSAAGPSIAVLDYGMGNRRSVEKALAHVGARARITFDHGLLREADALVVPGVGAFPAGMARLRELGLDELIAERARAGTPVLGICLGMQLLFEHSLELEPTDGLGLIAGQVTSLLTRGLRLPHIGWNDVRFERHCVMTADLPLPGRPFYHVHSFAARPADQRDIVATAQYGETFATIVAHGSVFGVQFHPEKSSLDGLRMLASFVKFVARNDAGAANLRAGARA
ncbi:MAG: imidazole glycerol phosphate synthase subunit HisH [Solirubrobacteraceae bacterium]